MIREASFEFIREPPGLESAHSLRAFAAREPQDELTASESRESEISQLTWAVLDGSATEDQRVRLAELVGAQHKRRRR